MWDHRKSVGQVLNHSSSRALETVAGRNTGACRKWFINRSTVLLCGVKAHTGRSISQVLVGEEMCKKFLQSFDTLVVACLGEGGSSNIIHAIKICGVQRRKA